MGRGEMRAGGRIAAVCAALAVGACGGNGSSDVPPLPSEASPAAWVENLSALHSIDNETYVGSGVIESLDRSPRVGIPGETVHGSAAVLHGRFRNGVGRDRLASYLTADALEDGMSGSGGRVSRFADPPVVRVAQLASEQHVYDVRTALQMINSSLPNDWQLLFDASAVAAAHQAAQPDGEIIIGFDRRENWSIDGCGGDAIGCAQTWRSSSRGTWEIVGGLVWIDHTRIESRHERVATIVHEILHVLGREHPDPYDFPDSIMIEILQENSGFMLSQLDREALLAVYGHLDPGTRAADIYRELGTWEDTSTAVLGGVEIPGGWIGFGAAEMNDHVQAWAYVRRPGLTWPTTRSFMETPYGRAGCLVSRPRREPWRARRT